MTASEEQKKDKRQFSQDVKRKALLCCERHCCLCNKQCDTNIEVHHIDPGLEKPDLNAFENAIPLCYDCHGRIGYDKDHRKGNKITSQELRYRRDQVYKLKTAKIMPDIKVSLLYDDSKEITHVKLSILNKHPHNKGKLRTKFILYNDDDGSVIHEHKTGVYGGEDLFVLNSNAGANFPRNFLNPILDKDNEGKWKIKNEYKDVKHFKVEVRASIIDDYDYEHELFPVFWKYNFNDGWYYEPIEAKK